MLLGFCLQMTMKKFNSAIVKSLQGLYITSFNIGLYCLLALGISCLTRLKNGC